MSDPIYESFLRDQYAAGMALARESDLLDLQPMPEPVHDAPTRYVAGFRSEGLVRPEGGAPRTASGFLVGIRFPEDYLRQVNPYEVVSFLGPHQTFHPNIAAPVQALCVGRLTPGTSLVDLIYQCWEILTWNRFKLDDCLDPAAAAWARDPANAARLPIDRRPLKSHVAEGSPS